MEKSASPYHAPSSSEGNRGNRASAVIKQIFAAEHPDHFTRSIPAQRLYLAVKEQGLSSSVEVLEMATREQFQLMLDFDLWSYDSFEEEQLWQWLELPDSAEDLKILQKFLHSIDPKLIALLIERYTTIISLEEQTETPPDEKFFTPDKGFTWVRVDLEDLHQEFLFNRLLALIFETSAELFYQLIQIPSVATRSALEEESYQEKSKRLVSEGFPDDDWSGEINSGLSVASLLSQLEQENDDPGKVGEVHAIPAFSHSYSLPTSLQEILRGVENREEVEQELTLICNSALIFFRVPTWEQEQVFALVEQVRGAIQIGIEVISAALDGEHTALSLHKTVGLQRLYRTGLGQLFSLRNAALSLRDESCNSDPRLLAFLAGLRLRFPKLPRFLNSDGTFEHVATEEGESSPADEKLLSGFRAFEANADIEVSKKVLHTLQP
ncbi:DUF6178 family protein [bacterium]|nr:DUF6178 family protein [bacterium]